MSTNRSVGPDLVGATPKVGRFTATQEKVRSPAAPEKDRSAGAPKVGRFATANKKDRSRLCASWSAAACRRFSAIRVRWMLLT